MPKLLENREVYDLDRFPPSLFAKYTKNATGGQNPQTQVRLRVALLKERRGGPLELVRGSWVCGEDADFEEEIRQNAVDIFERPISRKLAEWSADDDYGEEVSPQVADPHLDQDVFKELKLIRKLVYGSIHPLRRFLDAHYETIVLLYDWALSTKEHYWNTLTNQLIPQLPRKELSHLTAQDFDRAIRMTNEKFVDQKGRDYSDDRMGQFFSNLFAIMEYASAYYEIPNVLKDSVYYEKSRIRFRQDSLEKRVEKHLRMRCLDLEEELLLARRIMDQELEKINSLDPWGEKKEMPVSCGIAAWTGARPSENSGIHVGSRIPFSYKNKHKDRRLLMIQNKVTPEGSQSPDLKTINSFRMIPLLKVLNLMMEWEEKHIKQFYKLNKKQTERSLLSSRDGKHPIKPKELGAEITKLLRQCLKSPEDKLTHFVPVHDVNGELIPVEENSSAYQLRRNFSGLLLNKLGFPLERAMAAMGHHVPGAEGRRWMLYNEDVLTEDMSRMDKLILFPFISEMGRQKLWEQSDPRDKIITLGDCGEFQDAAALKLQAVPRSDKDRVTVRLNINVREPSDVLCLKSMTETSATVVVDAFYGKKRRELPLNNFNAYWDKVFELTRKLHETSNELSFQEDTGEEHDAEVDMEEDDYVQGMYETSESQMDLDDVWTLRGDELSDDDMDDEDDE